MNITDINDIPITYVSMTLDELTTSDTFVIRVPCIMGMKLASNVDAGAAVFARLSGTADPFVDIALTPIDLSPYDGLTKEFDMQVQTNDVVGLVHSALPVRVTYNP